MLDTFRNHYCEYCSWHSVHDNSQVRDAVCENCGYIKSLYDIAFDEEGNSIFVMKTKKLRKHRKLVIVKVVKHLQEF